MVWHNSQRSPEPAASLARVKHVSLSRRWVLRSLGTACTANLLTLFQAVSFWSGLCSPFTLLTWSPIIIMLWRLTVQFSTFFFLLTKKRIVKETKGSSINIYWVSTVYKVLTGNFKHVISVNLTILCSITTVFKIRKWREDRKVM